MTTFYLGLPGEDRPAIWRALKGTRLGVMSEAAVMAVPFHSVDAISWSSAFRWGFWKHYGQKEGYIYLYGIPGDKVDLGVECRAYERLASKVAGKWADELARLETAR